MLFVTGVVGADFLPESGGMVHVVEMGEFVENHVVAQDFRHLHEADIERNGAITGATAPAGGGMAEPTFIVSIIVQLGVIFEAVGEVVLGFFHEDALLSVAGTLILRVAEGDFLLNEVAINLEEAVHQKVAGMLGDGHLEASGR